MWLSPEADEGAWCFAADNRKLLNGAC